MPMHRAHAVENCIGCLKPAEWWSGHLHHMEGGHVVTAAGCNGCRVPAEGPLEGFKADTVPGCRYSDGACKGEWKPEYGLTVEEYDLSQELHEYSREKARLD